MVVLASDPGVEVEAERLDTGEMCRPVFRGSSAVPERCKKAIPSARGPGVHVDIKGFDEIFIFRGNGSAGTTGGDGGI